MNPAPVPTPSVSDTGKRTKLVWRNGQTVRVPAESPPAEPAPQPTATDDDIFTVGTGTGSKSPDVEPGVHRVVLTDLVKETGENPFEPGQQRTVFIFTFALANAVADGTWRYYTGVSLKSKKLTTVLTALKVSANSFKKPELVGREAQALIEVNERGYTRIANLFPA